MLIDGNTVSGNYWGRGISVVGGRTVTISNNTVSGVQKAAGIMVAQEDSWKTYGVSDVVIENNVVGAMDGTNANNGLPPTHKAAIGFDLVGDGVIRRREGQPRIEPGYDGFRALGNVCHFAVADTALASIAGMPVSLLTNNCPAADIVAYGNSLGGVALASPVGASRPGRFRPAAR